MLFVIDIGNTNIVTAIMASASDVVCEGRIETVKTDTADILASGFEAFLSDHKDKKRLITGVAISSVVPEITQAAAKAAQIVTGYEPLVLNYKTDTGITIANDRPKSTGMDLIAAAAGAAMEYKGALAIYDLGTATTMTVVTSDRRFIGGLIMPGVGISKEAMVSRASQLPPFDIDAPEHFIGRNTVDSMRSGIVYGNAAMMDSLLERVKDELKEDVTGIVTGGLGRLIYPYCKRKFIYEPELVLKGLWYIFERNK